MAARDSAGWWARLGGPNAVSLPAWWLTLPGAVLSTYALVPAYGRSPALTWFVLGGIGHVVCGLVLLLAWLTVLGPGPRPSRPWVFVAVVVAAGIVRGLWLAEASVQLGLADGLNLPIRLTSAPGSLLIWLSLATLIVDGSRRHRATMTELREQLVRERELVEESATTLKAYRAESVQRVADVVAEQLEGAVALSADPRRAAEHLQHTVSEVVRPLSHELERREVADERLVREAGLVGARMPVPLRAYAVAAVTARPFSPLLTSALVVGTSTLLSVFVIGAARAALCLGAAVLAIVVATHLARSFVERPGTGRTVWRRGVEVAVSFVAVAAAAAAAFVACMVVTRAWAPLAQPVIAAGVVGSMVFVVLGAQFAAAADGAVRARRRADEDALREAASAVEWASARLRQRAFLEQRQLGRLLHGEVQARIVSMALALELAPPEDPAAALAHLEEQVRGALGSTSHQPWGEGLDEVAAMWSHAIRLDVELRPTVRERLDADPVAAEAVVGVAREAITNAVRHGGADHVVVQVRAEPSSVIVDVTDDGSGPRASSSGLGSSLLDAVCTRWTLGRRQGAEGATLTAEVACAPARAAREEVAV